jgi:hypothetical protein
MSGCPECAKGPKRTLEEVKVISLSKGFQCLSNVYNGCNEQMEWRHIRCGFVKEATFSEIHRNTGCRKCSGTLKYTISDVKTSADTKGFVCLDNAYVNNLTPMRFVCNTCEMQRCVSFSTFLNFGCGNCSRFLSERMCRTIFQAFLAKLFPKCRPSFLNSLELDGFCEELNLAFEYQGKQHFEFIPHFHLDDQALVRQQERDARKRLLCAEHAITLIEIPFEYDHRDKDKMEVFIMEKLVKHKHLVSSDPLLATKQLALVECVRFTHLILKNQTSMKKPTSIC